MPRADCIDQGQRLLFSGHPAQLPPVGEAVGESFGSQSLSHLEAIVHQAAGSPIIVVTTLIRTRVGFHLTEHDLVGATPVA